MEILNIIIFILEQLLKYSAYLYKNFSFPLFLLIVILVFRKEISDLLNRIRHINFENNAGKVSISLAEINRLKAEMESYENFQIRQLDGEDPRDNIHLGAGPGTTGKNDEFEEYFALINLPEKTFKEMANNGLIKTIENLYNAYVYLTKDYQKENHEPTKIIKNIYNTAKDISEDGGYLFDKELVYRYRSFIQLAYLELMENNEIERKD
ncbi:hypothetical protein AABD41_09485 [Staphylococcus pseudoxylosus]|uniref:hypothetical protein n=1 Tax=Staphylococcus pseudoxylosus TaxID=2282419 RepID=UPI00398B4CB3